MPAHASMDPEYLALHFQIYEPMCFSVQSQWEDRIISDVDAFYQVSFLLPAKPGQFSKAMRNHFGSVGPTPP